jgi:ADP-heptose:LPS heptosyltransferase
LGNISPGELALELLNHCLRGGAWPPDVLDALVAEALDPDLNRAREGTRALFGILVERMADLFEPNLCEVYAHIFSNVIARVIPELNAGELAARYARVRQPRKFKADAARVANVFVLSRITLGADIAVTSVVLQAAKERFRRANVWLVGPRKNQELFARDPRVEHLAFNYGRASTLCERLTGWRGLRVALSQPNSIVIDPDSRLTQLGLLPVCEEHDYYFFESRSYGAGTALPLAALTSRWVEETFDVAGAVPYVYPEQVRLPVVDKPLAAVSYGVGENPAKRISDSFEANLLRGLARDEAEVVVDRGAGGEERERVNRAIETSGVGVHTWEGSFAGFASVIAQSALYVGYDSAGQHAAAALGVPLVCAFAGFASDRTFDRWRPSGPGPAHVVRVNAPDAEKTLVEVLAAAYRLWRG